jgi:hypothetical protein
MRLWQRPQRFVSLVKEKSRAWSSALLVATLTLGLASFGALEPNKPAEAAAVQCPADTAFIVYTYSSPNCTATVSFSGSAQTFTVPAGVTEITFEVIAAEGGQGKLGTSPAALGGTGGKVTGRLVVTGGTVLNLYVGGKGTASDNSTFGSGGWNGGGRPGTYPSCGPLNAAGGGGASDIRIGGTALANRAIVAGGGGGAGTFQCNAVTDIGGSGGLATTGVGQDGQYAGQYTDNWRGRGATQSAGGAGGGGEAASAGTLGQGGQGFPSYPGGGGGGGYYGGGGAYIGAGGGGSSWVDTTKVSNTVYSSTQRGNGQITLTYLAGATITSYTATNVVNATAGNNGFISGKSINYSLSFSMPVTGFGPEDISA